MNKQVEDTHLSQAVTTAQDAAAYDTNAKLLLADKQILARILKYTIREFRDMSIEEIICCIQDDIDVAIIPLDPGLTNLGRVSESKTEDAIPGEGTVYFDIRFSAYIGQSRIKFLIDLEAQRLTGHNSLGYNLENRIIYYIARMISAQKNIEFHGSDYDNLKNVRSIWICMSSGKEGDSIEEISLERKTVFGDSDNAHNIELLQGIIVNIRNSKNAKASQNTLISMLEILFSKMNVNHKKNILKNDYGMVMTFEIERRMQTMCNLSEGIMEEGLTQGRTEGELNCSRQNILDLLEDLGNIPTDIHDRIYAEENTEVLRKWHKTAARAESFAVFREAIS